METIMRKPLSAFLILLLIASLHTNVINAVFAEAQEQNNADEPDGLPNGEDDQVTGNPICGNHPVLGSIDENDNDPCMNEDNWNLCINLFERNNCSSISRVIDSCPYEFKCDIDAIATTNSLEEEEESWSEPAACASLLVYENKRCIGKPIRFLTFPTWTTPGSPCYHDDASLPWMSVKDQYCNMKTGNFHQTVFWGSTHCHLNWMQKIFHIMSPIDQTFTTDSCLYGYKLYACEYGPCQHNNNNKSKSDNHRNHKFNRIQNETTKK